MNENNESWRTYGAGDKILIDCKSFIEWISSNAEKAYSYIGKGAEGRTDNQLDNHLSKQGM